MLEASQWLDEGEVTKSVRSSDLWSSRIPFKELKISVRGGKDWLTLNRTKDELKLAPAYDKKAESKM